MITGCSTLLSLPRLAPAATAALATLPLGSSIFGKTW